MNSRKIFMTILASIMLFSIVPTFAEDNIIEEIPEMNPSDNNLENVVGEPLENIEDNHTVDIIPQEDNDTQLSGGGYVEEFIDWWDENYYPELRRNDIGNVYVEMYDVDASFDGMISAMPKSIYGRVNGVIQEIPIKTWEWSGVYPEERYKEFTVGNHAFRPVLSDGFYYGETNSPSALALHIIKKPSGFILQNISGDTDKIKIINSQYDIPEQYRHFAFGRNTVKSYKMETSSTALINTGFKKEVDGKMREIWARQVEGTHDSGISSFGYDGRSPMYFAAGTQKKGYATAKFNFFYYNDDNAETPVKMSGIMVFEDLDNEIYDNDIPDAIQVTSTFDKYYVWKGNYLGSSGNYIYGKDYHNEGGMSPVGSETWKKMSVIIAFSDVSSITIKGWMGLSRAMLINSWRYDYQVTTDVEGGIIDPSIFGVESGDTVTINYSALPNHRLKSLTVNGNEIDISAYPQSYTFVDINSNQTIKAVFEPSADLTINYLDVDTNEPVHEKYGPEGVLIGGEYSVDSPDVAKYELVNKNDSTITGIMPEDDLELDVFYKKLPITAFEQTPKKEVFDTNDENIDKQFVKIGDEIRYLITVDNKSLLPGVIRIEDEIPNGVELVEIYDDGQLQENKIAWTKNVRPKSVVMVSFSVKPIEEGITISNFADVTVMDGDGGTATAKTNTVENYTPIVLKGDLITVYKSSYPESGTPVMANDEIEYTLTVVNSGDTTSGVTTIKDIIPENTTFVENSAAGNGTLNDDILTWTIEGLEPQESAEVSFKVKVNSDVSDTIIRNHAVYSTDTDKEGGEKNTNEVAHPVGNVGLFSILESNKQVAPFGEIHQHDLLKYRVVVRNNGNDTAKNIAVVDEIPEGTEFVEAHESGSYNEELDRVEWHIANLEAGEAKEVSFVVRVLIEDGTIYNQALFDKDIPHNELSKAIPENKTNITENPVFPFVVDGDLVTVTKSSTPLSGEMVENGEEITYFLTVKNTGNYNSENTYIFDTLPKHIEYVAGSASNNGKHEDGTLSWLINTIAPGEDVVLSFKGKVKENVTNTIIRNHATYFSDSDVNPVIKNTNEVVHGIGDVVLPPALNVEKSVDKEGSVRTGEELTYVLKLTNHGGSTSVDTVITDAIPAGTEFVSVDEYGSYNASMNRVEWYLGDVPSYGTKEVSFTVKVTAASGTIYNQALFDNIPEEDLPHSTPKNSTNITETPIEEPPVIVKGDYVQVIKSSDPASGTNVSAGQEITYKLHVRNTGATDSGKIHIVDTISNYLTVLSAENDGAFDEASRTLSWDIPSLAPGKTIDITFTAVVNEDVRNALIKNHALYKAGNDKYKDEWKVTNEVEHIVGQAGPQPLLQLVKSSSAAVYVINGEEMKYTLHLTNNGSLSKDTVVTDAIPEGVEFVSADNGGTYNKSKNRVEWYLGDVDAGKSVTMTVTVKVDGKKEVIDNTALFDNNVPKDQLPTTDPKHRSNVVQNIVVANSKELAGTKATSVSGNVKTNDTIEYTIKITNNSKFMSHNTVVTDTVPEGTQFVSADNDGKLNGSRVEWFIGNMKAGESKEVKMKVKVVKASGDVKNTAEFDNNIPKDQLSKATLKNKTNEVVNKIVNPEPIPNTGENGRTIIPSLIWILLGLILLVSKKKIKEA